MRDALPQSAQLAGVRDDANQIAGFIAVAHGKIEMLFLHPAARGQGAGRRLLTYAIGTFGATTLDVNEQNEQAVGFYLRMGFRVIGRSERDSTDKPYPLLHLQLASVKAGSAFTMLELEAGLNSAGVTFLAGSAPPRCARRRHRWRSTLQPGSRCTATPFTDPKVGGLSSENLCLTFRPRSFILTSLANNK